MDDVEKTESLNNPPAFPRTGEGFGNPLYDTPGMSLRDWFAGQALSGMLAHTNNDFQPYGFDASVYFAEDAYRHADAMLAARERTVA